MITFYIPSHPGRRKYPWPVAWPNLWESVKIPSFVKGTRVLGWPKLQFEMNNEVFIYKYISLKYIETYTYNQKQW